MMPRKPFLGLRRFRHHLTLKLFGRPDTFTNHLRVFLGYDRRPENMQKTGRLLSGGRSPLPEHFGRKARIPDLFDRRDQVYLALEAQRLHWHMPPPYAYHDLLDAAARVGRIEGIMGYKFKDKMICIEALKTTSATTPLYFNGVIHHIDKNNRLALLGDRVISLALCDVWFKTGNTNGMYCI